MVTHIETLKHIFPIGS